MNADPAGAIGPHAGDEDLLRLIDGELQAGENADMQAHVAGCAACAARLHRMQQLSADMSAAYRVSVRRARVARLGLAVVATVCAIGWVATSNAGGRRAASLASLQMSDLPVKYLTPGATRPVTSSELCQPEPRPDTNYDEPDVPASVRHAVLRNYGAAAISDGDFELDYLITPELGGAMDAQNLWPERYTSATWNAHVKDDLERLLHQLVCRGSVPLESAQRDIATNWIAAYKRYFHTSRPGGWPATLPQPLPLRE
jgi:hypothetical protein